MKRKYVKTRKNRKTKKKGGSMEIVYPSFKVNSQNVNESETTTTPTIKLYPLSYSTLIMYDPDAINPPYLHYLVINIKNGVVNTGDTVVPYTGSRPPPGSGVHKYIFQQFEQTSPFLLSAPERNKFDLEEFKKQHNLALKATKMYTVSA